MPNQLKFLDFTGSQYLVQKVKSAINDVDSSLSTHIADTDIHVTTADKNRWNNQTYVFRYSSTALTPSSTNSNTLLDNTDNLKVGDKVIDSSGVLFSVTAIDTQNSTFTIGTALIDLAQDSDVVHKSGVETITGFKQFANIRATNSIKAINLDSTTTDLNNCYSDFAPYGENKGGNIQYYYCNTDAGTANISNLPEAKAFVLTSITTRLISNSLHVKQILINSNSKTFVRYCSSSTWSSWVNETDSEYVHKSGDETVGGVKTFTDFMRLKSNVAEYGVTGGNSQFYLIDKNGFNLSKISQGMFDNSASFIRLQLYGKDSNNQTVTNTITYQYSSNHDYSYLLPIDNSVWLGNAGNRWGKVYGIQYYYGSNNVEFSTKFVTTDTNQTISGDKTWSGSSTFQQNITYQRTNFYHQNANPSYILKDTELEKGSLATTHASYPGLWQDKNNNILGYVRFVEYSSGTQTAEFRVSNLIKNGALDPTGSEVNCTALLVLQPSGEKSLIPEQNNDINLGTSTNKWKTLNGVEPSSLSLPSDRSARIDISSYITNLGNGDNNQYIVPANGYIWLHFTSVNSVLCYSQTSGGLTNYAQSFVRYSGDGLLYAFFPVRKNDYFIVQIYTSSTAVVQNAYFIPCQGNV